MVVAYDFVLELKKAVQDNFGVYLHFHDSCGGQSFSIEEDSEELRGFITDFFAARGINIKFTVDGLSFYTV